MTWEIASKVLIDAAIDSAKVFAFVFLFHILLSFIEDKLSNFLIKNRKSAPLFGSMFGVIPQCGTSVLAADLFNAKYITMGTLTAVFLSCSDEALIVLLTSNPSNKMIMVIPLILSKFLIGYLVGIVIDLIYKNQTIEVKEEEVSDVTCSTHHHHGHVKIHKHLIHPLVHSLEILLFVFIVNVSLGLIVGAVGEEVFKDFVTYNRYLTPLLSSVIGIIPNCVSSVLISELYLKDAIPFGALLAGLLMNAGIGMMILIKNHKNIKINLVIIGICFATALFFGYITSIIEWFAI